MIYLEALRPGFGILSFLSVLRKDISGLVRQRILSSQASSDHIPVGNGPIERGHHFLNKASTPCSNILYDSRGDMRH